MKWTKEQELAINTRNCNLLVSAAAGSGKTAVLVERIISRVLDKNNPIDIDKIIVVTFTKAAAEEMKGRIVKAFEKQLENNPSNSRLVKQIALTGHAKITTIDSFCTYVLRNYYNSIGFNPAFRVADAGELALLKSDVYNELLEEYFERGDKEFIDVVEKFSPGKKLDNLFEIISSLQSFSESHPWPEEWLEECIKLYDIKDEKELNESPVIRYYTEYVNELCIESLSTLDGLISFCKENEELSPYLDALYEDRAIIVNGITCDNFFELGSALTTKFSNLKPIKNCSDPDGKELVQSIRNGIKKRISSLGESLAADKSTLFNNIKECGIDAKVILNMTIDFTKRLMLAKEDRNIVSFSDIEHKALQILVNKSEGIEKPTEIADELAAVFEEIYIDEYQDSNFVQEKILNAVSRERFGQPNIFMVGDVKQSIYKFRMAKPELFIEKYNSYASDESDSKYKKIELHSNFRSTQNVIDSVNNIFYQIMHKSIGGIDYNNENALNYGGNINDEIDTSTEFCVMSNSEMDKFGEEKQKAYAYMAAHQIEDIMKKNPMLNYKDFVILLRSDKKAGVYYAEALNNMDIPAVYSSTTGYFSAYEIKVIMDVLRVIDNPRQEIPLADVLRSFFGYFTSDEMALVKGKKRKKEFYDCLVEYSKNDDELAEKCKKVISFIAEFRRKNGFMTIKELVSELIYKTGFYDFVGFMSNGKIRKMNLDMMILRANEFEKTSYSGLFNFIRYMDKIKKYEIDYSESSEHESDDNYVKIMSIHHSKGLQFPVVILGDASKDYNMQDTAKTVVIDSSFGIGMDKIDLSKRTKSKFIFKEIIKRKIENENIGEELRILYVALTRAIQKLVILSIPNKKIYELLSNDFSRGSLDMEYILDNKNYAALIGPAIRMPGQSGKYKINNLSAENLLDFACKYISQKVYTINDFMHELDNFDNKALFNNIKEIFEFKYPHVSIKSLKSKYSVSEIKHMVMEENERPEARVVEPERTKKIPIFIEKNEEVTGTQRGNAYHKFFEILDYSCCKDLESLKTYFDTCVSNGTLSKEYADLIKIKQFEIFLHTELGKRMAEAAGKLMLFREQPFIMEIQANLVEKDYPENERVLIQGIVDAFFFENDKVYIVDYKTDRVNDEKDLIDRYKKQLELYAETLSNVTGKEVGGCYIYSTCLGKEIIV